MDDEEECVDEIAETGEALLARIKELAPKCAVANIETLVNAFSQLAAVAQGE